MKKENKTLSDEIVEKLKKRGYSPSLELPFDYIRQSISLAFTEKDKEFKETIQRIKEKIEKVNSFHWDEIQKILDKKEKGDIDINLDISFKIHNNGHNECVSFLKIIDEEVGGDLR